MKNIWCGPTTTGTISKYSQLLLFFHYSYLIMQWFYHYSTFGIYYIFMPIPYGLILWLFIIRSRILEKLSLFLSDRQVLNSVLFAQRVYSVDSTWKIEIFPCFVQITWCHFATTTRCVCETQMPTIMANSQDGQIHKDKYLETSTMILWQAMLMCNMK